MSASVTFVPALVKTSKCRRSPSGRRAQINPYSAILCIFLSFFSLFGLFTMFFHFTVTPSFNCALSLFLRKKKENKELSGHSSFLPTVPNCALCPVRAQLGKKNCALISEVILCLRCVQNCPQFRL